MLDLTYSNRTEALVSVLTDRVRSAHTSGRGVWEPIHVVVPNPMLKEYVRQSLARELGVAANLQFSYMDGLWKGLLQDDNQSLLAFDLLRAGLMSVLGNQAILARPDFKPVRDYLGGENRPLKRVQLATELARVFEEYQLSRPDWIDAWRAGRTARTSDPIMEAWQMRLWREVLRVLDAPEPNGQKTQHLTLLERIRACSFAGMNMPRAIHAFGLSHVAQAYQEIFQAFRSLPDTTLHIYALNPCGEFWEDLDTNRKPLWTSLPNRQEARKGAWDEVSEDFYGLSSVGPRALRLWGRPGREKIRLLNEAGDCDFSPAFEVPDDSTILGKIQRDILLFQDPSDEGRGEPDGSVRCLACPSPRREAEVVATEIWRLMEQHSDSARPLRFSEIAVVVPPGEQEVYLAHLQAAFQDTHRIPMVQSDRAMPILRETLEAVKLMLELPTSGLTRSALLRVLMHPGLQRRLGDFDVQAWGRWCEELGIVRGADKRAWEGTYLERDALNWDQGLKRLTLGAFMEEGAEFQFGDDAYLIRGARETRSAATFISLVRGLCREAQDLLLREEDPQEWASVLFHYLERWLQMDEGEEAEAVIRALERIRSFLERAYDRVPAGLSMPRIDFVAARHLALEALERLQSEQFASLSRGVVVATHATMRAIPFRAIFLMGNGEGSFPTRNQRSALDLRSKQRRPGDVSQTEKDTYLFLELLLSAREHLVVSYVAKDELSGEPFEPSGLFKEFRSVLGAYLAPQWAPTDVADPFLESHPLRRFDPLYFPEWFPLDGGASTLRSYSEIAAAEARALHLGNQARSRGVPLPCNLGDLKMDEAPWLREMLATPEVLEAAPESEVLRLSIQDLKTFLECPLTGAAAVRLGLRRRDVDDRSAVTDEPFESEFLETWSVQRKVALGALRENRDPEDIYDQCIRQLQSEGAAPFGVFSDVEREGNLDAIRCWVAYLKGRGEEGLPRTWRLGANRSGGGDKADHVHPPLSFSVTLDGRPRRVELSGELRVQLGGSLSLESGKRPSPGDLDSARKKALAAFIDHHVLACLDPGHTEHHARFIYQSPTKGSQEVVFSFPPLTPKQAEERLRTWVQDLLTGNHAVLLPIEAVIEGWGSSALTYESILEYVDAQMDKGERASFSTLRGPVPDPTRYAPPPDPQPLLEHRLGDFLDIVCGVSREEEA